MQTPSEQLGKIAFEAYGQSTKGKTHDGRDIPSWENLTDSVRAAWIAAAKAVEHAWLGIRVTEARLALEQGPDAIVDYLAESREERARQAMERARGL